MVLTGKTRYRPGHWPFGRRMVLQVEYTYRKTEFDGGGAESYDVTDWRDAIAQDVLDLPEAPPKRIEVDIGAAAQMLKASPELAAEMTRLVNGEVLQATITRMAEAEIERDELEMTFELRYAADQRAIMRWRAAKPGRELTLPDHADLCEFLLEQLEARG